MSDDWRNATFCEQLTMARSTQPPRMPDRAIVRPADREAASWAMRSPQSTFGHANIPHPNQAVTASGRAYNDLLVRALMPNAHHLITNAGHQQRILVPTAPLFTRPQLRSVANGNHGHVRASIIDGTPYRVLDAPELVDNYYLSVMSVSRKDCLAIGLGSSAYMMTAASHIVELSVDNGEDEFITSVQWCEDGSRIAIADQAGGLFILGGPEADRCVLVHRFQRDFYIHRIAWYATQVACACLDGSVVLFDERTRPARFIDTLVKHTSRACGLSWSRCGRKLASGANDNTVAVWDVANLQRPLYFVEAHRSAVKALAWSPFRNNTLASGGGIKDCCIKLWNTSRSMLKTAHCNAGAQVCDLTWSPTHPHQLLAAQGYHTPGVSVWNTRRGILRTGLAQFGGNTRALAVASMSCADVAVAAATDETVKLYSINNPDQRRNSNADSQLELQWR